jgi:HK97 family phage major capsid protein
MPGSNVGANDDMIRRLETELREKKTFADEIVHRAQSAERDLTDEEKGLLSDTRGRMEAIKGQLETIEDISRVSYETATRARQVGQALDSMQGRHRVGPVEYRSAGAYVLDMYRSAQGDRQATDRLEMYYRAADHARTGDEPGIIPDPIVGPVVDFIDAARPVVNFLGPRPMPYATWHRPVVNQHTAVAAQGAAGAAADEKTELTSQKLTITRLTANAATYGGYVNVSKQLIDFSQPGAMDVIINDLAAQFAIETEAVTDAALAAVGTAAVNYDLTPSTGTVQESVAGAIWAAAAAVYAAVRGQGRLFLALSPDMLQTFGPLFAPYGPFNQFGEGFNAANFGQGVMGNISGVPAIMSSGLGTGKAFLASTAAIEVYEQRVGTLQITEPSVMGVQVAYAGYFTPLVINAAGIVPLAAAA